MIYSKQRQRFGYCLNLERLWFQIRMKHSFDCFELTDIWRGCSSGTKPVRDRIEEAVLFEFGGESELLDLE